MRLAIYILVISLAAYATFAEAKKDKKKKSSGDITSLSSKEIEVKKKKKHKSTSSSSGEDASSGESRDRDSLGLTDNTDSSSASKKKRTKRPGFIPKSSEERRGWRKWHRKCKPCPFDMKKKWKDPTIKWICGGYQRARRSFKSVCMMRYRNCQDGTMFVKVSGGRCRNQSSKEHYYNGDHFFYEYPVKLSDESSNSKSSSSSVEETESSVSY